MANARYVTAAMVTKELKIDLGEHRELACQLLDYIRYRYIKQVETRKPGVHAKITPTYLRELFSRCYTITEINAAMAKLREVGALSENQFGNVQLDDNSNLKATLVFPGDAKEQQTKRNEAGHTA